LGGAAPPAEEVGVVRKGWRSGEGLEGGAGWLGQGLEGRGVRERDHRGKRDCNKERLEAGV